MYAFPKSMRVRTRPEFQRAFNGGVKVVGAGFVFFAMPRPEAESAGETRLGLVVSRKVGSSVVRNKVKRRVRESFRLLQHEFRSSRYLKSVDLIVVARASVAAASSQDIARELDQGLTRLAKQLGRRQSAANSNGGFPAAPLPAASQEAGKDHKPGG